MSKRQPTIPLKKLSVKFVGSGDELCQIVSADELSSKKKKKSMPTFRSEEENKSDSTGDENGETGSEDEQEEETIMSPSKALIGDSDVDAGQVYSFRTPKRSNRAAQMAARSVQKKKVLEEDASKKVTRSATKIQRSKQVKEGQTKTKDCSVTLSKTKVTKIEDIDIRETSNRRRSSRLAAVIRQIDEDEEVSEEESSSDDDVESIASVASSTSEKKVVRRSGRRKVTMVTDKELEASSEGYFLAHVGGVVTSDHTLSRLAKPQMDQKELKIILKSATNSNNDEMEVLYDEHTQLFEKWMLQLSNGFNLLLYGLGSKRHLVESFRSKHLSNFCHMVINGFFPGLAIRHILGAITDDMLDTRRTVRGLQEQLEVIKVELESKNEPIFLIFHNLDGSALRVTKNQMILSSLAQISGVNIIATIDHINAPLIWDQGRFGSFNWLWYDVTTYQDYTEETSYENSLLVRQSGALTLSSISHVLKSVPPNVQGVFNILVEAQLEHKDDISYSGMTFQDLYQRCREAFYVSSDLTLRAQLTEFKDHKLLTFKKGIDGAELLSIPVESSTLQEFKQQEEF